MRTRMSEEADQLRMRLTVKESTKIFDCSIKLLDGRVVEARNEFAKFSNGFESQGKLSVSVRGK